MTKEHINFKIFLRAAKYPVIVVSENELYSTYNIKQLAEKCFLFDQIGNDFEALVLIKNQPPLGVVMFCRLCLYLLHEYVQETVSCYI
jgi:hypothetical protein